MKLVLESKGTEYEVIIDDDDYEKHFKDSKIFVNRKKNKIISIRERIGSRPGRGIHRIIMGVTDPKVFVDHIDGNVLNNSKSNLRISDALNNAQNRKVINNGTISYNGVTYEVNGSNKSFRAQITNNKKNEAKMFKSLHEAIIWRYNKEKEYYGENRRDKRSLEEVLKDFEDVKLQTSSTTCTLCNKTFKNAGNLENHMRKIHIKQVVKPKKTNKTTCDTCGKEYSTDNISRHKKICRLDCNHCDKTFKTNKERQNHEQNFHNNPSKKNLE